MRSIRSLPRNRSRTKLGDAHSCSRAASATSRASSAVTLRFGSARLVAMLPKCNTGGASDRRGSVAPAASYLPQHIRPAVSFTTEEIPMSRIALVSLALGLVAAAPVPAQRPAQASRTAAQRATPTAAITIPYQRFVLKNGLTLLVHEDHKAPIVAVNIWYHVGSKNERPGRTGFAHLFEHLMFNGSEHYNTDYFQALEPLGATDLNGTTNEDRTNYFQNVPTSALDVVLWMESDRMGHLLGAIDQPKLDEQRGVVQNEKRQGENEPYGKVDILMTEGRYTAGHPYAWSVIGSMADLG